MEYANAVHIERASKPPPPPQETPKKKAMNGDSMAVEPSKTVNPSPGLLDPENKLNAEEISMLRSESINSINNSSGRSSRLGRVFTAKHEKSSKSRRALLHKGNLPRGEVEMSIRYAEPTKKLVVQVLRAKQLLAWDKNGQCNPYATVKLISLENSKDVQKRKTGVVKGSVNPCFDNHFEFNVEPNDLHNYKLLISVKDDTNYGAFSAKPTLGQIEMRLTSLDKWSLAQQWIRLEAERN
ncbi:C2 domain protein [Oesophagostomum dentatum]|uniref:C2 domain protein n=1 Tax=Oesophagostomum dentatum TaxID=61180 RepID=A0A0B1S462_OESDE|nr:C2 domain protein [Oesophagostomum dentatum]